MLLFGMKNPDAACVCGIRIRIGSDMSDYDFGCRAGSAHDIRTLADGHADWLAIATGRHYQHSVEGVNRYCLSVSNAGDYDVIAFGSNRQVASLDVRYACRAFFRNCYR